MICEHCGVVVPEGRESCPSCGARIYPASSYMPSQGGEGYGSAYTSHIQATDKRRRNRLIGAAFLVFGIVLFLIGFMLYTVSGEWMFCSTSFILIGAGIIVIATNLTPPKV